MRRLVLLVLVFLAISSSPVLSAPMTIAVGDFNTKGASYSVGQSVIEILYGKLAGDRRFRLVERRQLDSVARQQRIAMSGMVDSDQAVKIGKIVGAKYYIQGAVSNFGVLTLLTARMMDIETRKVVSAYQVMTQEGEKGVLLAARKLSAEILSSLTGPVDKGSVDYKRYLYDALGYYNLGDYRRSLRYWDKMVQLSPKDATLRFIISAMHYSRGRYRDSELSAREAISFDPSMAHAYLLAGKALFMEGKFYEATDYLDKASDMRPDLAEPYFLIGQSYKNRGRLEEAMEYFSITIQKDPNYVGAYVAMGQMLLEAARLDLAKEVLTRAVQIDGNHVGARFLLGTTLLLKGDEEGAKAQRDALKSLDRPLADELDKMIKE